MPCPPRARTWWSTRSSSSWGPSWSFWPSRRPGGGAVATSGSYERFYDGDHRYHHLVDAGSGMSPGEAT
ncbi:MAG: FAD:protein FMN transferase, partial [Gemmatimonadota bacterium]